MNKCYTRTALAMVWTLLAGVLATIAGVAPQVAAVDAPPAIVVAAKASSALAAGAQAIADITVRNAGDVDASGPVVLSITGLPVGVTVLRIDESVADRQWNCAAAPVRCTLASTSGVSVGLAGGEAIPGRVRLAVASGTTLTATLNLTFTVTAGSTPAPDLSQAAATVTFSRLASTLRGSIDGFGVYDALVAGKSAQLRLDVTNLGPATVGGSGSTVAATGLLPPGATSPTVTGTGWACTTSKSGVWTCTWTGTTRAVGATLPTLVVSFTSPPTATSTPITWTRTLTAIPTGGGTAITRSDSQSAVVLGDRAPVVNTIAQATTSSIVEPGQTVPVTIGVEGSGFDDAGRTITVRTTLPTGWTYVSRSGTDPWTCAVTTSQLSCTRSAAFASGASRSTTDVLLRAPSTASAGAEQTFAFIGSVSGPGAADPTSASVPITVAAGSVATSSVSVSRYSASGTATPVTDGTAFVLTQGISSPLGLEVLNTGGAPIARNTVLALVVTVPTGSLAVAQPDGGTTAWTCAAATSSLTSVSCRTTLATDLAPGSTSPRLRLGVTVPVSTTPGPAMVGVAQTATLSNVDQPNLHAETVVNATIVAAPPVDAARLSLATEVMQPARDGGAPGIVRVTASNTGTKTMAPGWTFSLVLPAPLTAGAIALLSGRCNYAAKTFTITCDTKNTMQPGKSSPPLDLPVLLPRGWTTQTSPTRTSVALTVTGSASGSAPARVDTSMQVLPPVLADAIASPTDVVLPPDPALPVPAVQLDGRGSVAIGATVRWEQIIEAGQPVVSLGTLAAGAPSSDLLTSFAPPTVTGITTLRFRLTISDGWASSSATVAVTIAPATSTQGSTNEPETETTTLESTLRSTTQPLMRSMSFAPASAAGEWTWSTPPTISPNDVGVIQYYGSWSGTVWGSRMRVLDPGVLSWVGDGAPPPTPTVTYTWRICEMVDHYDPITFEYIDTIRQCTDVGSGSVVLNTSGANGGAEMEMVATATDDAGTVTGQDTFPVGLNATGPYSYAQPKLILSPTLAGNFAVGDLLTLDPGEWSLEWGKVNEWQRCTPDLVTCAEIAETVGQSPIEYVVTSGDIGFAIRVVVTAYSLERETHATATTNALQGGVSIACDPNCFTWSVEPEINRDGADNPTPVSTRVATLVNDGSFAWVDASTAPSSTTKTVAWFACSPTCVQVGTGRTYTPQAVDIGKSLEARLTVTGTGVDGIAHSTTHVVAFGQVRDIDLGPAATVQPSITGADPFYADPGNPFNVLTAHPGTWAYASGTSYTFTWQRCQAVAPDACVEITGQHGSTYVPTFADQTAPASVIRVDVTATGLNGTSTTTERSTPSPVIDGYLKKVVTPASIDPGVGGPRDGVQMTATPAVWSELPQTLGSPSIEWESCTSPTDDLTCSGFGVASATFTPGIGLVGSYLRVRSTIRSTGYNPDAVNFTYSPRVGPIAAATVAVTAATDLAGGTTTVGNGEHVTVTGSGTGVAPLAYTWLQTSGATVDIGTGTTAALDFDAPATGTGSLGFRLTVTDGANNTATADIAVNYVFVDRPGDLCELVDTYRANPGEFKQVSFGAITLGFVGASVSSPRCDQDTTVTISNAVVTAFGWLSIFQVNVYVDADRITVTGGTVATNTGTGLDSASFSYTGSLVIPLETGDGSYEIMGVLLGTRVPNLVDLPFDWKGGARLALGTNQGVQTLGFSAVAWDGPAGTPDGTNLPIPPTGVGVVRFSGAVSTDESFSLTLTADDVVTFKSTPIDFAGSISRASASDPVVVTASATLAAPGVALASNVQLTTATLAWDGTTFTGSGSVNLSVNGRPLALTAGFSFTDPGTWSATLALSSTANWTPVPGLTITAPSATGTIAGTEGARNVRITISAASATIGGQSGVTLTQPSFTGGANCLVSGSCSFDFTFSTGVSVSAFGPAITGQLSGRLDPADGSFTAQATLGAMSITSGISFTSSTLKVTQNSTGLSVELSAVVQLFGAGFTVRISFAPAATVAVIEVGSWTPFSGAPQIQNAFFIYSSAATTVMVGGRTLAVPKNTLWLSATAPPPVWFKNLVGGTNVTATIDGTIGLSPLSLSITLTFQFDHIRLFNVGGVELYLDEVTFNVQADGSSFSTRLAGIGELSVPSIGSGGPSILPVDVSLYFNPTTAVISGGLTLGGNFGTGVPAWNNAFGVPGLTIQYLSISVGIGGGLPSIGFSGGVVLPDRWASQIGIQSGTQLTLSAALAGANSCFGVGISQPDPTRYAVDVGGLGALVARSASFYIAPEGCTIGSTVIPKGISLAFDGKILGVAVKAKVNVIPTPLSITADFTLGDISLSGLSVRNTTVHIDISETTKAISFAAKADVFGVRADVTGSFKLAPGGATAIDFTGHFFSPHLGGFQLDHLDVSFAYTSSPPNLTLAADAQITLLGQPQHIQLAFTMENGAITRAEGAADLSLTLADVSVVGRGRFVLSEGSFPDITITGTASIGGHAITTVSARLNSDSLQFAGTLNLPGVFQGSPQLSGFVAWSSGAAGLPPIRKYDGSYQAAQAGDFRFDATNVGINVAGFALTANVTLARVGGVFFADIQTTVGFGLDQFGGYVTFRGAFSTAGDVALSGVGVFRISGFANIGVQFALSRTGGNYSLTGSATLNVPGMGSMFVSGSFSRTDRFGSLYTLTGSLDVRTPNWNLGHASVSVYRALDPVLGIAQGVSAHGSISIPGFARGGVDFEIESDGRVIMHSYVSTQGFLKDIIGAAYVRLDLQYYPSRGDDTMHFAFVLDNLFGLSFSFTLTGSVSTSGQFNVSAGFDLGPYHDSTDMGLCRAYYDAYATMTLRIAYFNPIAYTVGIDGDAYGSAGCGVIGIGVGLTWSFTYNSPTDVSLRVRLHMSFGTGIGSWNPVIFSV